MQTEDPVTHTGKRMLYFAGWVVALTILYFVFSDYLSLQRNPNQNPASSQNAQGRAQVVLERNRQGHYLVSGSMNGFPTTFMLDTGATDVSIPVALARKAGLSAGRASLVQTANGIATVYQTEIDEISIGNIQLLAIRANINPNSHSNEVLLGMSFLKNLDFTQEGKQLTLKQR